MSLVLGLDVSTSCIGVCIIDDSLTGKESIVFLDRIELKRNKDGSLWSKSDQVRDTLAETVAAHGKPSRVIIEEPLMGFRANASSAQTITTLMRFNGIVSYIVYKLLGCEPEYISAAHARKLCGMKLTKTNVGGPHKEQVFAYMKANDLKHVEWPKKKNGQEVDWSRDATDSYVIARAAIIEGEKR